MIRKNNSRLPPKDPNVQRRYLKVQARYDQLFNKKRMRFDDCIKILQDEFCYTYANVLAILRTDMTGINPDTTPPLKRERKKKEV